MAAPTTIAEAIQQAALRPKRVKDGNQEVEQHDLAQLMEADRYTKSTTAGGKNHLGLRFMQIKPPGAS